MLDAKNSTILVYLLKALMMLFCRVTGNAALSACTERVVENYTSLYIWKLSLPLQLGLV